MTWTEEERGAAEQCGQRRMPFEGGGKVLAAWGEAGLTGQQQRCLVPPGFLLKTWPPSRSRVSSFSSTTTLSFIFLSSFVPSLHHPPVPALHSSISHTSVFVSSLPPRPTSGPLQTLSNGLRGGGMRRWRGTKALRCNGPTRVAGIEKKLDRVLMQRVNGRTEQIPSFILVFKPRPVLAKRRAHHPPCALPSTMLYQAH